MGSMIAASIERLAISRPRGTMAHAGALSTVGSAILLVELYLAGLDHGTHLLLGLVLVVGTAVFFGPGPATSGMVAGGGTSVAAASAAYGGVIDSPLTYLQLAAYLVAGGAIIALVSSAIRARSGVGRRMPATAGAARSLTLSEPLTERELEILRLGATGISVDDIARRLFLSPNTVKTHLTHVYAKLGVRGRPDAIRAGLHFGCLTPADICPHRYLPADEPPVSVGAEHSNG
jgi:DNA-binding CsgD family transcriptional regulator